jgi:tetratricopeptide (TPR) repeat protein
MDPARPLGGAPLGPPRPAPRGTLAMRSLSEILVDVREWSWSGTLELRYPGDAVTIAFASGHVTKVRTEAAVAYLGSVLYERGSLETHTLNESLLEVARSRRLHGEVCRELGVIDDAELEAALREQTLRKLAHARALPKETEYELFPGEDRLARYGGAGAPPLDPLPLVLRWAREHGGRARPLALDARRPPATESGTRLKACVAPRRAATPAEPDIATLVRTARAWLEVSALDRAELACNHALAVDPDRTDVLALLTWIQSLRPECRAPARTREKIAALDRAIQVGPASADAFYYRGKLRQRLGEERLAVRDFDLAVAVDARHVAALRELRVYEMRTRARRRGW